MAKKKKQEIIKTKCPQCNGTGEFKRKKINGKKKGNRGELKVCKILTDKLKMGKFNRVPSSGAFGSTHVLSKEAQLCLSGDLIAPSPDFVFSIENKCGYNDVELSKILMNKPQLKQLGEFLEQACTDAARIKRIPMVIYTKDYREPVAVIPVWQGDERYGMIQNLCDSDNSVSSFMVFNHKMEKFPQWSKWIVFILDELIDKAPKKFFFVKEMVNDGA